MCLIKTSVLEEASSGPFFKIIHFPFLTCSIHMFVTTNHSSAYPVNCLYYFSEVEQTLINTKSPLLLFQRSKLGWVIGRSPASFFSRLTQNQRIWKKKKGFVLSQAGLLFWSRIFHSPVKQRRTQGEICLQILFGKNSELILGHWVSCKTCKNQQLTWCIMWYYFCSTLHLIFCLEWERHW